MTIFPLSTCSVCVAISKKQCTIETATLQIVCLGGQHGWPQDFLATWLLKFVLFCHLYHCMSYCLSQINIFFFFYYEQMNHGNSCAFFNFYMPTHDMTVCWLLIRNTFCDLQCQIFEIWNASVVGYLQPYTQWALVRWNGVDSTLNVDVEYIKYCNIRPWLTSMRYIKMLVSN